MSSLFKKLREREDKEKKRLKERMGKENILNMQDPSLHWGVGGWARGASNLSWGPSGCLDASTHINYQTYTQDGRRQDHKGGTIEKLYNRFNKIPESGMGQYQRSQSINSIFTITSIDDEGRLIKNNITAVLKSGIKECFLLTTKSGNFIKASADHKFMSDGVFKPLSELKIGDKISIFDPKNKKSNRKKIRIDYKEIYVKYHPSERKKIVMEGDQKYEYFRIAEHRAVVEANLNGMSLREYKDFLNSSSVEDIKKLKILRNGDIVHHINENKKDNDIKNLAVMTTEEHTRLHVRTEGSLLSRSAHTTVDIIESIESVGMLETYDIVCDAPFNNFLANNFVVHNSGKSTIVLMAAAEEQKKTGGWVYIFDSEYAHNDPCEENEDGELTAKAKKARDRYQKCGLDVEKIFVKSSNKVDKLFEDIATLEDAVQKGSENISAIIVDSWGGIQSEQSYDKIEKGEIAAAGNSFGGNAKTTAPILQTLLRISAEGGVTSFFVQHCMKNMDQYGPKYLMIGGEKLKFLVDVCVYLESVQSKTSSLLSDGQSSENNDHLYKIGKLIRFKCDKSRNVVEGRKSEFYMDFENCKFALPEYSLTNLALGLGVIGKVMEEEIETSGKNKGKPKLDKDGQPVLKEVRGWYAYPVNSPTPVKFHGLGKITSTLAENKALFEEVYQDCLKITKKNTFDEKIGDE